MLRGFAVLYARAVIDRSILQAPGLTDAERARRALAVELAEAALAAVEPERATRAALARLEARGVPLSGATVFAFGKASVGMARAALAACAPRGGIVVAPGPAALPPLEVRVGGHPTPAPDAIETGDRVLALARSLGPGDVALCLISGGGSSMLERPRDSIALETVQRITRALLAGGADIGASNTVRRALSAVKGGRLAAAIAPARVVNVILSDVPGAPLDVVASGPTLPPRGGDEDAAEILARHGLSIGLPPAEPLVRRSIETTIESEVAADSETARAAVRAAAEARGLSLTDRQGRFDGEARALGARLAREPASAWVWGGETTVTLGGGPIGRGGRNQELALAAIEAGLDDGVLLALATDGVDGASQNAGGLADAAAARALAGRDLVSALERHDASPLLEAASAALHTGPTGTNVADLLIRV